MLIKDVQYVSLYDGLGSSFDVAVFTALSKVFTASLSVLISVGETSSSELFRERETVRLQRQTQMYITQNQNRVNSPTE